MCSNQILQEGPVPVNQLLRPFGVSPATIFRWCTRGSNGVPLECIVIAGRRYSSQAAVERWIAATNRDSTDAAPSSPAADREASIAAAERSLAAQGV